MHQMLQWLNDQLWTYQNVVFGLGINGLLALAMYVVLAVGQLSLGQAAFMGLGAYSSAMMTLYWHWPFWAVLPASIIAPAGFALLVGFPTLRLAGVYLAIATIGLGEVLRALYFNADNFLGTNLFGGALGLSGIPMQATTTEIFALLALAIAVLWLVGRSRIGRAMAAIRDDALAAEVAGIPLRRYRMGALLAAAVLAGIAGCLEAHVSSFIGPDEFGFQPAVSILSYALLGGIGTPIAPVIGAWVLTLLPEMLRGVAGMRMVLDGGIIVLAVLFLPSGIVPWRLRRRAG